MAKPKNVDEYIEAHPEWRVQLNSLRSLLLSYPFEETIKWSSPVYTLEGKNLIGLAAFKNHCALWFFQGVLLTKNKLPLHNAQEGKTENLRQIRFENKSEIDPDQIKKYIEETIQLHKKGVTIKPSEKKKLELPEIFKEQLDRDLNLKECFFQLSPGKQRDYATYIKDAKKEETRRSRLEKIIPMIKSGIGLNDKYQK